MATNSIRRLCLRGSPIHGLRWNCCSFVLTVRNSIIKRQLQRGYATATPGESGKQQVSQIVEDISRLTLLETADLIAQLKVSYPPGYSDSRRN
jgi:Ribosomal protein L7/L12 dimerisation domain